MEFFYSLGTYERAISIALLFFMLIQLYFYLVFYVRVIIKKFNPLPSNTEAYQPISVVICARNEEENLKNFLPKVLEQDYPDFEVIVVNDCSNDNSDLILDNLKKEYSHLKVTTIKEDEKFTHAKKLALTVGIKAAKNEWLVLTDADCFPKSDKWLKHIASNFTDGIEIVFGYGGYLSERGFLNKLIRLDALQIALNYFGWALAGKPYMGVGRNLAYKKSLFFKNKGFASHAGIESGDDDLFVMEVANKKNTAFEYRPEAHTLSVPRKTYSAWLRQKRRHLSTSKHYSWGLKTLLTLEPLSRIIVYVLFAVALYLNYFPIIIVSALVTFIIIRHIILAFAAKKFDEKRLLHVALWWDLYSILFYTKLLLSNNFNRKQYKWK
ncbi:glycosyltransferase [Tenuifilum thalassicum]|uniref:Glycosyltransferase n=1 Tax=Tenuifilum thalassicum TaxID=2590900 RepID=A0A7D4BL69_9BACT|nr:glycosyltransferase [Tenuifilum thalassicum]QKG80779.1 glycosyltransferase [Tenuifilum thalassicum]